MLLGREGLVWVSWRMGGDEGVGVRHRMRKVAKLVFGALALDSSVVT